MFAAINTESLINQALEVVGPDAHIKITSARNNPQATIVAIRTGDTVSLADGTVGNPPIYLRNANDGKTALIVHSGLFRLVCSNGLVIGSGYAQRVIHTAGPKLSGFLDQFSDAVAEGIDMAYESERISHELIAKPVTTDQAIQIVGNLDLTTGTKQTAIQAIALGNWYRPQDDITNLWGFYNMVNELNRTRSRSQLAAGIREFRLLDDVQALYEASAPAAA